jgi:hypothetical protein
MSGLVLSFNGTNTVIPDGNITFTTNTSGSERIDLVQYDGTSVTVVVGTPGASPQCPSPATGCIPILVVRLATGYTGISNIDQIAGSAIMAYYNIGGMYASKIVSASHTIASGAASQIGLLRIPVYLTKAGFGYETWSSAMVTGDVSARTKAEIYPKYDTAVIYPTAFITTEAGDGIATANSNTAHTHAVGMAVSPVTVGPHYFSLFGLLETGSVPVTTTICTLAIRQLL